MSVITIPEDVICMLNVIILLEIDRVEIVLLVLLVMDTMAAQVLLMNNN